MADVCIEKTVTIHAEPAKVWSWVADTDRFNRRIGLGSIRVTPKENDPNSPARFRMQTTTLGVPLEYEEYPTEWVKGEEFRVFRKMLSGPVESTTIVYRLAPQAQGHTLVTVSVAAKTRSVWFRPLAWVTVRDAIGRIEQVLQALDTHLSRGGRDPFADPVSEANDDELSRRVERLKLLVANVDLVTNLERFLREAPDADCARVRPYELADRWKLPRRDVLEGFLRSVEAGMFELRWSLVCPSCRTESASFEKLEDISETGHCQFCDLSITLDLDKAFEATFLPHPRLRKVELQPFCIAGPARMPHVIVQKVVPIGAAVSLQAPEQNGRYRLFVRGVGPSVLEVTDEGDGSPKVKLLGSQIESALVRVRPRGTVVIENAQPQATHAKIEFLDYPSSAATAHELTLLPEFRRIFSSDLVRRDKPLKVAHVTLLFSDLVGSTALYSKVGDAAAFRLVDDHFDVLREAVESSGGAVVKTMGDAVMAAFENERDCAKAAIASLRAFERFRLTHDHGRLVGLKLGMHAGPCYVVTANGLLDYFGQVVNVAARVQALANASELVLADEVYQELSHDDRSGMRVIERLQTSVKGIETPMSLVRLVLTGSIPPPA